MRHVSMLIFPIAFVIVIALPAASACADDAAIRSFKIHVDDAVLDNLNQRLANTRWPDQIEGSGWEYGVDLAYMKDLVAYWRSEYDWREHERQLNRFDQFITNIDGIDMHFIHQRSKHADALPLVIVHGWPGSIYEFYKIIGPLTDPEGYGGNAADAFHVVCPSLPGFGFSGKPTEPGWSVNRMSDAVAKLMERLGYERYGAQGGDWGAGVSRWLGNFDSEHVVGVHLNFVGGSPPREGDPYAGVSEHERRRHEQRREELSKHKGYSSIQGTRPLTLGYALVDSPAGQAAWIIDKFWAWSDHGGNIENSFTRDELLTNVMIYWVTQSGPSSARIYFERQGYTGDRRSGVGGRTPIGVAMFPKEINVPPRAWVERGLNVTHWTDMPRGGHFAALEVPQLLVEDIRKFFRDKRSGG